MTFVSWQTHQRRDGSFVFQVYTFGADTPRKVLIEDTRPTRAQAQAAAKRGMVEQRRALAAATEGSQS